MATLLLGLSGFFSLPAKGADYRHYWGHPSPQGNPVNGISFIDANEGFAVGDFGGVLHTTDSGVSWELINDSNGFNYSFNDVYALDGSTVVAVGTAPGIFRSVDGGYHWSAVPNPSTGTLMDITPIPGGGLSAAGENGHVLISADNGLTWMETGPGTGSIRHHLWKDQNVGFAVGVDVAHRTDDGGATWIDLNLSASFGFNEIFFVDGMKGYVVADFERYETLDGGSTWTELSLAFNVAYHFRTLVLSPTHWLVFCKGEGAEIHETLDAGETWNLMHFWYAGSFHAVQRLPSGRIVASCDTGDMMYSDDDCVTLTNAVDRHDADLPSKIITIAARGDGVIFAANQPSMSQQTESWLRSDDGGLTWTRPANSPGLRWVKECGFAGSLVGVAASYDEIRYTSDGGETWGESSLPSEQRVSGLAIPEEDRIFLCTYSLSTRGHVYFSDDGGVTWTDRSQGLPTGSSWACGDIEFFDGDTGYLTGSLNGSSRLYATSDAGMSWTRILTSGLIGVINSFEWLDAQTCVAAVYSGQQPGIYRSADGGATWVLVSPERTLFVDFHGRKRGVAIRSSWVDPIRVTHDGGLTWKEHALPVVNGASAALATPFGFVIGSASTRLIKVVGNNFPSPMVPKPAQSRGMQARSGFEPLPR